MGEGIQILFDLENGFNSADGTFAVANTLFDRQSWIGMGTAYGTIRVVRQYSPIY
ncbi:porin, partial [Burkholderia pyrrocinia]|uniref:porin n=1 Tax=Burkholderia pyrrocinia TaxID=60550 RepID=UPI0039F0D59F